MMDYYQLPRSSSYEECLKVLEADIQHANMLATSIPRAKGSPYFQMKLSYNHLAPIFLFLLQWLDCSCTCLLQSFLNLFHVVIYKVCPEVKSSFASYARKATIREFYAVILPSLQLLHDNLSDQYIDFDKGQVSETICKKKLEERGNHHSDIELEREDECREREDECGICLEPCTKMVLPSCCHAMCINCYHDWNMRSESCPFCRGSLKRVDSGDLWVLPCNGDVIDHETVSKDDMLRLYLYINSLPKDIPDALFLVYYEYLI